MNISSGRNFIINEGDILKLLNYLVKLPYQEVFMFVNLLQGLKVIKEDNKDANDTRS